MRATLASIRDRLPPSLYFLLAGSSAGSLNGDHNMTEPNGPLARLRKAFRSLEDLPEVIPASWRPGIASEPLPVETASVDDIAIAIVAANATAQTARGCRNNPPGLSWVSTSAATLSVALTLSVSVLNSLIFSRCLSVATISVVLGCSPMTSESTFCRGRRRSLLCSTSSKGLYWPRSARIFLRPITARIVGSIVRRPRSAVRREILGPAR